MNSVMRRDVGFGMGTQAPLTAPSPSTLDSALSKHPYWKRIGVICTDAHAL